MRHDDSGRPQPDWQARLVIAALVLFGALTIYNYYRDYRSDESARVNEQRILRIKNQLNSETDYSVHNGRVTAKY
jgi:hypothetical protein